MGNLLLQGCMGGAGARWAPIFRFQGSSTPASRAVARLRQGGLLSLLVLLFGSPAVAPAKGHALIVAVSEYPALERRSLAGPLNDAGLMRDVARRLGIDDANVLELSDGPRAAARPTRAAILAALDSIRSRARPGEWVLLHFSGHGTQLPQVAWTQKLNREPDELDEVFLARDARQWVPGRSVLEGAIRDDEIGLSLRPMLRKGVNVWAVFDTCHAADLVRAGRTSTAAAAGATLRGLSPEELGVPVAARLTSAPHGLAAASTNAGSPARRRLAPASAWPGKLVAFYASASHEPASEELFPDPAKPGSRATFGVLTWHLHAALLARNGPPATFRELAARVTEAYADRPFPTPEFVGPLHLTPAAISDIR